MSMGDTSTAPSAMAGSSPMRLWTPRRRATRATLSRPIWSAMEAATVLVDCATACASVICPA